MFRALRIRRARMPLLSKAFSEWGLHIQHLADGTRYYYLKAVGDFLSSIPDKPCNKVKSSDIQAFVNKKLWTNKKSSVNKIVIALRRFCFFMAQNYGIPNPAENIKSFKKDHPYQPFINRTQYEKILASAEPLESDVIRLLACSGMRASELAGLRFENISENFSSIRFTGKGGKERSIPLNATMREILSRRTENGFINLPKSRRHIYYLCTKAGKRAEIYLAPHMLRRYFASQLVGRGVSLLIASKLLGHSSVRTTEIYLHLDSSFLAGSTDVLD